MLASKTKVSSPIQIRAVQSSHCIDSGQSRTPPDDTSGYSDIPREEYTESQYKDSYRGTDGGAGTGYGDYGSSYSQPGDTGYSQSQPGPGYTSG